MRFEFESISAASGNQAIGNFLDNVAFGIGVPEPTTLGLLLLGLAALPMSRRRH